MSDLVKTGWCTDRPKLYYSTTRRKVVEYDPSDLTHLLGSRFKLKKMTIQAFILLQNLLAGRIDFCTEGDIVRLLKYLVRTHQLATAAINNHPLLSTIVATKELPFTYDARYYQEAVTLLSKLMELEAQQSVAKN